MNGKEESKEQSDAMPAGIGWYLAGVASVGSLTGFFAGFSNSPVIATLLPLVFTLVAGTGGIYIAKMRIGTAADKRRARFVGQALVLFAVSCMAFATYGITVRNGSDWNAFLPGGKKMPASLPTHGLSGEEMIQLVLTRAHLRLLGATEKDEEAIISKLVAKENVLPIQPVLPAAELSTRLKAVLGNLDALLKTTNSESRFSRDDVVGARARLKSLNARLETLGKETNASAIVTVVALERAIANDLEKLSSNSILEWFDDAKVSADQLLELHARLLYSPGSSKSEVNQRNEVLETLRIIAGRGQTASGPEMDERSPAFAWGGGKKFYSIKPDV